MNQKPWEIEPGLAEDCLSELARILRDVRHKALHLHDPVEGDGPWCLGCRIYERTINTIERKSNEYDWLRFHRTDLYFVIFVNNIPIRFYKGRIDKPTARTLRQRYPETTYKQLPLSFYQPEWFWRIAIETEEDGSVFRIVIAQFEESGTSCNTFDIPLTDSIPLILPVEDYRRESIVLEKPLIVPKTDKLAEGTNEG